MSNTDLLFAGTSLNGLSGLFITDWSGMFSGMFRRGDHVTVPNRVGQLGNTLPLDAFNFPIGIMLEGATEAAMFTNLTALATALAGSGGLGMLERRVDNGSGGYTAGFANGAFAGISPTLLNLQTGQMDLTFGNLSGRWFTTSGLTVPVPI